jgi:hypothetical protein
MLMAPHPEVRHRQRRAADEIVACRCGGQGSWEQRAAAAIALPHLTGKLVADLQGPRSQAVTQGNVPAR